jgi:hypothetical protein
VPDIVAMLALGLHLITARELVRTLGYAKSSPNPHLAAQASLSVWLVHDHSARRDFGVLR